MTTTLTPITTPAVGDRVVTAYTNPPHAYDFAGRMTAEHVGRITNLYGSAYTSARIEWSDGCFAYVDLENLVAAPPVTDDVLLDFFTLTTNDTCPQDADDRADALARVVAFIRTLDAETGAYLANELGLTATSIGAHE